MNENCKLVLKALLDPPVSIFDDDTNILYDNQLWELVNPRPVENVSTREIGSANIFTAYNLLYIKNINKVESVQELFLSTLNELQKQKYIRKKPEQIRKTFKTV